MTKKERKVDAISAEIAALDEQLGDMALYENDPDKANLLSRQRGELAKSLEQAEADWLEASEAYEAAHV
jgi:ATP-binding cassette subfamily F protein 3